MDGWLTISLANYCCCGINVCIIILGGVVQHGGEGSLAGSIPRELQSRRMVHIGRVDDEAAWWYPLVSIMGIHLNMY